MVFDCFTFFNEVDLLEFRIKYLQEVVDYHVIVESNLTFSGKNKPYYFEQNIDKFLPWKNKIYYIKIEQSIEGRTFDTVDKYTPTNGSWELEYEQRNSIWYAKDVVSDKDLVLIGDLDEIPDKEKILNLADFYAEGGKDVPYSFSQLFHYYYMNCQNTSYDRWWNGTVGMTGKSFKEHTPQEIRDQRNHLNRIPNGGYHFSFLGGVEKVKEKIQSFAHTEFDREDIISEDNIKESLEKGIDVLKRPGVTYKFVDPSEYPEDIRNLMLEHSKFIKW